MAQPARVLALEPRLLLDQPFSCLDLVVKVLLIEEDQRLAGERGFTVLLVSHDPLEAAPLCREAVVLREGEIEEAGSLAGLHQAHRSEQLRAFRNQLRDSAAPPGKHASRNDAYTLQAMSLTCLSNPSKIETTRLVF